MDEIEFHENITLIREALSNMSTNVSMQTLLERITVCLEFMQEQITELQDTGEE